MPGPDAARLRRGLWQVGLGRALSGLLGLIWLAVLLRLLPGTELGVYFGWIALAELLQLLTVLGASFHAQRYVPEEATLGSRHSMRHLLVGLLAWRAATLALAALVLALVWPRLPAALGWPGVVLPLGLAVWHLLADGLARFAELLLGGLPRQGPAQVLAALRNMLRLAMLGAAVALGVRTGLPSIVALEAALALAYVVSALVVLARTVRSLPDARRAPPRSSGRARTAFALRSHSALALGQVCGANGLRLIVSHVAGPGALAAFGLALALAELIGRYLPAALLHPWLLTAYTARGSADAGVGLRLLLRTHAALVVVAIAWFAACAPWLVARLGGPQAAATLGIALMPLLAVQGLRLMAAVPAHVREDSRAVWHATLATLPAPLLTAALAGPWGPWAAVLGLWLLETAYTAVLLRQVGLPLRSLTGRPAYWWRLGAVGAAVAAAGLTLGAHVASSGATAAAAALLCWSVAAAAAALWVAVAGPGLDRDECDALRSMFRRAGAGRAGGTPDRSRRD